MANVQKIVQVVDAVCDCLPVISTITNGAQLLYKLAHKVDAAANPVAPGLKTELKIHILSKASFIGFIPLLGNLIRFIKICLYGVKRDQLMAALNHNNTELVRLCLASTPLNCDRDGKILYRATDSKTEIFDLILNGPEDWSQNALVNALSQRSLSRNELKHTANANKILDYWSAKFSNQTAPKECIPLIVKSLTSFAANHQREIVKRVIPLLPPCELREIDGLLSSWAFGFGQFSPGLYMIGNADTELTQEERTEILNKCQSCSLSELADYCSAIKNKQTELRENLYRTQIPDPEYILDHFEQRKSEVVERLLQLIPNQATSYNIVTLLSSLAVNGERNLLERLLTKYQNELAEEDIMDLLKRSCPDFDNSAMDEKKQTFKFLLEYFRGVFSDEDLLSLRDRVEYSDWVLHQSKGRKFSVASTESGVASPEVTGLQIFDQIFPQIKESLANSKDRDTVIRPFFDHDGLTLRRRRIDDSKPFLSDEVDMLINRALSDHDELLSSPRRDDDRKSS